jgi:transglutaminase/protease-like cytokinesis protein 3
MEQTDFRRIDDHALGTPHSVTHSINEFAAYLARPAANDTEKARALFRWIAANIEYDVQGYFNPASRSHQSLDDALKTRKGVCAAYSSLFQALADHMGLEAATISGHGKGYSYTPGEPTDGSNHDWNAVRLDGESRLIDCTWGAGHIDEWRRFQRAFDDFYFLTPPRLFVFTHFPEDPQWQLLPKPIDRSAYDGLLCVKP